MKKFPLIFISRKGNSLAFVSGLIRCNGKVIGEYPSSMDIDILRNIDEVKTNFKIYENEIRTSNGFRIKFDSENQTWSLCKFIECKDTVISGKTLSKGKCCFTKFNQSERDKFFNNLK